MNEISTLIQNLSTWFSLLQPVVVGLMAWGWWALKKTFVQQAEFAAFQAELEKKREERGLEITALAQAQHVVSQAVTTMPKSKDMSDLLLSLEQMKGQLMGLQKESEGQREMLKIVRQQGDRMNAYLLERGGK